MFPGIAVGEALRARGHEVMLLISEKKVDAEASAKYRHLKFETMPAVAKRSAKRPGRHQPGAGKIKRKVIHRTQLIRTLT